MPYIKHSAKGTTWGKHKYIVIRNGRYIYPDDENSGDSSSSRPQPTQYERKKIIQGQHTQTGRTRDKKIIPGEGAVGTARPSGLPDPKIYKKRLERQLRDEGRKETELYKLKNGPGLFAPEASKNSPSLARKIIRQEKKEARQLKRNQKKVGRVIEKMGATVAKSKGPVEYTKYKKQKRQEKAATRIATVKATTTRVKETVNKGKSAVSSFLSRFKKRG